MPITKCRYCCQVIELSGDTLIWRDKGILLQAICTLSPDHFHEPLIEKEETELEKTRSVNLEVKEDVS